MLKIEILEANWFSRSACLSWSWGYVSAVDSEGRTIWIVDAHRDDGKRFVVRADEKLTAFVELEWADLCFAGSPKVNHHWSKSEARRPNNEAMIFASLWNRSSAFQT